MNRIETVNGLARSAPVCMRMKGKVLGQTRAPVDLIKSQSSALPQSKQTSPPAASVHVPEETGSLTRKSITSTLARHKAIAIAKRIGTFFRFTWNRPEVRANEPTPSQQRVQSQGTPFRNDRRVEAELLIGRFRIDINGQ